MASSCPHEPSHWIEKLLHPDAKARHHPFHSIRFRSAPLQKKTEARPDCSAFPTGSVLPYLAGTPFRHKQTRQIDVACNMDSKRQASRTPVRHRPAKLKTDTRGRLQRRPHPGFPSSAASEIAVQADTYSMARSRFSSSVGGQRDLTCLGDKAHA